MTLRIGHRGAAGYRPENTLESFRTAIGLGVDLIELDVQRTRDGHLVVMHDKRVDRTTDGTGEVADLSLKDVRQLDAGGGERVPTLDEVVRLASGRTGLMLEIIEPGIERDLRDAVGAFPGPVIYASFHHRSLLDMRRTDPTVKTLALLEGAPVRPLAFAEDAEATHVGLALDSIRPDIVPVLQAAHFAVFAYTANDPRDIDALRRMAVDGIISDFPDRV